MTDLRGLQVLPKPEGCFPGGAFPGWKVAMVSEVGGFWGSEPLMGRVPGFHEDDAETPFTQVGARCPPSGPGQQHLCC